VADLSGARDSRLPPLIGLAFKLINWAFLKYLFLKTWKKTIVPLPPKKNSRSTTG